MLYIFFNVTSLKKTQSFDEKVDQKSLFFLKIVVIQNKPKFTAYVFSSLVLEIE